MILKNRKIGAGFLVSGLLLLLTVQNAYSWGFWAHKRINRLAVFTLPSDLIGFYKQNLEFITDHAVDPDKRRYAVVGEDKNHYIDIDYYGTYPFEDLPRDLDEAVEKYTLDTLMEYGYFPWNLQKVKRQLTKAFEQKNTKRILQLSADIGHYIGDGHVPLHTTINYNGQLTGQKGIHGFWESRCPELFADENYDYFVGKAEYITDVEDFVWNMVLESHSHVAQVFALEKELTAEFPDDKKYAYDDRNKIVLRTYSFEFAQAYEQRLDGMIEDRMRKAIHSIGSIWMTCWIDAGQPDLIEIMELDISAEEKLADEVLDKKVQEGKIKGREHDK